MNLKERIINGLLGQAIADAAGNPFEFRSLIKSSDVSAYAENTKSLVISDDTQMAIFGLEAIINLKNESGSIEEKVRASFTKSYLNWYTTQTRGFCTTRVYNELLRFKSLFSIQSPGCTCLSALKSIRDGKQVINDSFGCGSVMRLLPVMSLLDRNELDTVVELGKITGSITHLHRENNRAIEKYILSAYILLKGQAVKSPSVSSISDLGSGWTAMECVDMALWAYNNANSFEHLLELSIAHDGDSDSVAAVAGSLWGISGKRVPIKYINKLDALDAIDYITKQYENI